MSITRGVLALAVSLSFASLGQAQDTPDCPCPMAGKQAKANLDETTLPIQDDDQDKAIKDIEARLNEILVVEESGRIVLREEFKDVLPFPAERVESMLGQFVELGEDGKMRLKDPEAIRPYIPMIRGFLGRGGLDQLKKLRELPPEERREAMQRLFGPGGQTPVPFGNTPPEREPERSAPRAEPPAPRAASPDYEERLDRLEGSVERIERMLTKLLDEDGSRDRRRARERDNRQNRFYGERDEPRSSRRDRARRERPSNRRGLLDRFFGGRDRGADRDRGRDRDRGFRGRRGPRDGGLFGDLFRGRRDRADRRERRSANRERWQEGPLSSFMERSHIYREGIETLLSMLRPEDFELLQRALSSIMQDFDPTNLQNPAELLPKIQESLDPDDTARVMEIFSDFIATPEGRALVDELEALSAQMEAFMNSPEADRWRQAFERLQDRMGGDGGEGQDRRRGLGAIPERLEELVRPRRRSADRDRRERRSSRQRDEAPRPRGSKLY